ncbi:CRISPR-associated endonuclease Cas2 [bacterium]|nr:CRISPR-associated endonuclease Cas2 [bacterium]|tara:strand:- start:27628 stop:28254 length:627 start_codon:yes stop_codon:yes gene_type:complete
MVQKIGKSKTIHIHIKIGKRKEKKIKLTEEILFYLGAAGIVTVGVLYPIAVGALGAAFVAGKKHRSSNQKKVQSILSFMKKKGYVKIIRKNDGKKYVSLTNKGKEREAYYKIRSLSIEKPQKWDNVWRIVFFDIPAHERGKRNALRDCLRRIGFQMFQKSVWIFPFPCEEEVSFVKQFFNIHDSELRLIESSKIGDDKKLKKIFKITL